MGLRFTKMHGLGNDFVIIDGRDRAIALLPDTIRTIADRHTGVGCDQLILLEPATTNNAHIQMRIHNADGHEVEACGNATRCVAHMLFDELDRHQLAIATSAGILLAESAGQNVTVDMGPVRFEWQDIPLSENVDTCHLPLQAGELQDPVAVNIGNPHAVFFVPAVNRIPMEELGPRLETASLFPDRANIGVAEQIKPDRLRLRVWERGVGVTRACGTGACAAVVAATRRGLMDRQAKVELDGGILQIEWRSDGHVVMTGPTATSFTGEIDDSLLTPGG